MKDSERLINRGTTDQRFVSFLSSFLFFFVLDVEDGGRTGTGDLRGLPQVMGGEAGLQQLRL